MITLEEVPASLGQEMPKTTNLGVYLFHENGDPATGVEIEVETESSKGGPLKFFTRLKTNLGGFAKVDLPQGVRALLAPKAPNVVPASKDFVPTAQFQNIGFMAFKKGDIRAMAAGETPVWPFIVVGALILGLAAWAIWKRT